MLERSRFLEAVKACVGTPVRHMGRRPGVGLDCVGLPIAALATCGVVVPPTDHYGTHPDEATLTEGLASYCDRIDLEDAEPGDLLQVLAGRQARHVEVFTGYNECGQKLVTHAWARNGKVQVGILTDTVMQAWRIREIDHG